MADHASFPDDISKLWGDPAVGALEPVRWNGTSQNGHAATPPPSDGGPAEAPPADDLPRDGIARLADALASRQVDVVRHAELLGMRSQLEDAFTQQLAVALYELLSTSNERFAAVEAHIDQRVQDVTAQLRESVTAEGDRLAAAIEAQRVADADLRRSASDELERLIGPVEALAAFEREVRHEVRRLGDLVAAQKEDAGRRSATDAGRAAGILDGLGCAEGRDTKMLEVLDTVTGMLSSLQADVTRLHAAVDELREEATVLRRRTERVRGLRGRSFPQPGGRSKAHDDSQG